VPSQFQNFLAGLFEKEGRKEKPDKISIPILRHAYSCSS
jgi:hypothetical protein